MSAAVTPPVTNPGDLVLTHGGSLVHQAIRAAQAIRFRGPRRKFTYWNHVAVVVGKHGEIVEAMPKGVRRSHVEAYEADARDYQIVNVGSSDADRAQMVAFAESCVGQQYGFLTIVTLLVWVLFGGKLVLGLDGTEICSGLAAQAVVRDGTIFARNPAQMMPADIAEHYRVRLFDEPLGVAPRW